MFGDILRELRKDFNMTQAELAEMLSLSPLTISAYECGRSVPDDATKVRIAKIFNVSLDYLLGLIREPFPYKRSANTILLPSSFTPADAEKVQEYIQFLEYQKKKKRACPRNKS